MDASMIAYTLKQDDDGQWSIRCMGSTLASGLSLEPARRQAYEMAHAAHMVSGRPTCVEVISAGADLHAAIEAEPQPGCRLATA